MKTKIIYPNTLFGRDKSSEEMFLELQETFVNSIEKCLSEKKMSKSRLAMKLGISRSAMSKLLSKEANLSLRKISEIATALNVDVKLNVNINQSGNAKYLFKITNTE